ncbi:tail fiber protein [Salmonella enterica]|nr:tail fiber protein [Salmonella enterica]
MGKLTELEQWEDDVYQIETSDPVLGGPDGVSNRPQKQLANRTQWLKKQIEQANNDLADHIRSRNHPDATLTDKGFVRLYSGVTSLDETMAATPKAVKIAMNNASERLAKARNLSDLQSVPQALQALTIATTKKAVEDTQIGLDRQPVMLISTADDLSNLPAGARRFARNNTGVTVLPTGNNCYIEVLAKRDMSNGTCIQVVEHNNPGNEWTGTRGDTMTETSFTWVRQYNESHRPPQQEMPDMPDALIRGNNLSDLTDPPEAVQNLGLTDTVNRALHVNSDGDIRGSLWGDWLSHWLYGQFGIRDNNINARATIDWVRQNFLSGFRLGAVESAQVWRAYGYDDNPPYVITGVINDNADDLIDFVKRRSLQMYINGWRNIDWL